MPYVDLLHARPAEAALRQVLTAILTADPEEMTRTVTEATAACARLGGDYAPYADIARHYPGDPGVIAAMLLNHVRLQPGEAIYLGAGNVHAYLRGTGVEIMANSDNVLRCGLTTKHVDVDELLAITDFTELPDPRWPDSQTAGFGVGFDVPVPDFQLYSADLDAYRKPGRDRGSCATGDAGKPYLVLCVSGGVRVRAEQSSVALSPGRAAFVPARDRAFTLEGTGQTFLATVGLPLRR
jgi:mannose-6-phosphate isomerase